MPFKVPCIEIGHMTTPRQKYFAVWLSLAIYMVANGIGVAHTAETGDNAHDHHGQACAIQHAMDTGGHALAPDQSTAITGPHYCSVLDMAGDYIAATPITSDHQSRAPPIMPQFQPL